MFKLILLMFLYTSALFFLIRGSWGLIIASQPMDAISASRKIKISGVLFGIAILMTIIYTSFLLMFLIKMTAVFLIFCLIYMCVEKIVSRFIH